MLGKLGRVGQSQAGLARPQRLARLEDLARHAREALAEGVVGLAREGRVPLLEIKPEPRLGCGGA